MLQQLFRSFGCYTYLLYLLHNVNADLNVFLRNLPRMKKKVAQGLHTVRPFDGVAVFERKHVSNLVTFCDCYNYGMIAGIKLDCQTFELSFLVVTCRVIINC